MSSRPFHSFAACMIVLSAIGAATAQEPAAEPTAPAEERTYQDLRRSENKTTQRLAERYFNLVRVQSWTSDKNQAVTAKYVSHTPDMKTVTLAVAKGSGKNRTFREVKVEVARLNKTCQSRVRQIATLQAKLDELAAAPEESNSEGEAAASGEYGGYGDSRAGRPGAQPVEEDPAQDMEQPAEPSERDPRLRGTAGSASASDPNDPDPLGFSELENEPPLEPAAGAAGALPFLPGGPPPGAAPAGEQSERANWAGSYDAFVANLTVTPAEGGEPTIDWGELTDLRALNEAAAASTRDGQPADPYRTGAGEILQRIPEVNWSATYGGINPTETGEQELRFAFPPPPDPLTIRFIAESEEAAAAFSANRPGTPVTFTGRLDIKTPNEILVTVRPADAAGSR